MSGRIIKTGGGYYIDFGDDYEKIKIEGDIDEEYIEQNGGKLLKKAKKKLKKKKKNKKGKKKSKKRRMSIKKKPDEIQGPRMTANGIPLTPMNNPMSQENQLLMSLMRGNLNNQNTKDVKEKEDLKKKLDETLEKLEESKKEKTKLITDKGKTGLSISGDQSSSSSSQPSSIPSGPTLSSSSAFRFDDDELKDPTLLISKIETLKKELGDLLSEKSNLTDDVNELHDEISKGNQDKIRIEEQYNNLVKTYNESLKNITNEIKEKEDDIDDLNRKIRDAEDQKRILEEDQKNLRSQLAKGKFKTAAQKAAVNKRLHYIRMSIIRLHAEKKGLDKDIDSLKETIKRKEDESKKLTDDIDKLNIMINELNKKNEELKKKAEESENKFNNLEKQNQINDIITNGYDFLFSLPADDQKEVIYKLLEKSEKLEGRSEQI